MRSVLPFQSLKLDISTLLYANGLGLIGFQLISIYLLSQAFARREGLIMQSGISMDWFRLERGLITGLLLIIGGLFLSVSALLYWQDCNYGPLNPQIVLRKVIPAVSLFLLGFQVLGFSFFMSFLQIGKK